MRAIPVFILLTSSLFSAPADDARVILDKTQTKGGVVVHLGGGDGNLTAALRANASYAVQGLGGDQAAVDAARKSASPASEMLAQVSTRT